MIVLRDFEIAKSENEASKLREPKPPPRYLVWDTTVEKLGELLTRSDKGILVLSDEISIAHSNVTRLLISSLPSGVREPGPPGQQSQQR